MLDGTWFYASVVNCIKVNLNASLRWTVRKEWGLSDLNDWRSLAYVTKHRSVISLENLAMAF